ncbi:hypothetical protein IFM89_007223 [Coptis chinensis]|uniref:Uncharacterized protein n=1 Tax=Coptis chinensis TaxID=261450 RepID=A0A835II98_9MAGN|nr:hypothetical protein IFM89_007223 [Coptis chinensis]
MHDAQTSFMANEVTVGGSAPLVLADLEGAKAKATTALASHDRSTPGKEAYVSASPNRVRVLEEAGSLLQGNWADQVERDEAQASSKKGYKPKWKAQNLPAPSTRAKASSANHK